MDWAKWAADMASQSRQKVRRNDALLHWLVQQNAPEEAWAAFLAHKPPLDRIGHTALGAAIVLGRKTAWRVLLNAGAPVNQPTGTDGWTALHLAARANNPECVRALILAKAFIDAQDESGLTPLHIAARHDALEAARELVTHNACQECTFPLKYAPVHIAAMFDAVRVFELLRDARIEASGRHSIQHIAIESKSTRVLFALDDLCVA